MTTSELTRPIHSNYRVIVYTNSPFSELHSQQVLHGEHILREIVRHVDHVTGGRVAFAFDSDHQCILCGLLRDKPFSPDNVPECCNAAQEVWRNLCCGCVRCICDHPTQCQGCGAKECKTCRDKRKGGAA